MDTLQLTIVYLIGLFFLSFFGLIIYDAIISTIEEKKLGI